MRRWLRLPTRESMEANRFLRPFARHLASPLVWRFNRRGVARGAALGVFLGFLLPLGLQTPVAAMFAVGARANLPVAALATLVTNPLTFPLVYLGAYAVGRNLLPLKEGAALGLDMDVSAVQRALDWAIALAGPTIVGLVVFAVVGGVAGYVSVQIGWRLWVGQKWNRRQRRRRTGPPAGGARPANA
ncbi:MAG: DUF2062 domain-containing protein [Sphingomonadaceae bacterium]